MSNSKKVVRMGDETRLALLEQTLEHIDKSLVEIKSDSKIIRQEIASIKTEMNTQFKWIIGVMVALFSGLYATALGGMVARLCKWV